MIKGLGPGLVGPSSLLGFHFLGSVLRRASLGDLEAEGLADVELGSHERSDAALAAIVLDAADRAHLVQDVQGRCKLLLQLGFPYVLDLRGEDHGDEEKEQHPVLAFLRPAALAVKA